MWLAERGWRVTGVDFSTVGLEKARALAEARGVRAEWVAADLLEYRPELAAFDLVIVFYLQVPAPERTPILRRAAAAVAPGGTFLLVVHDSANIEHGHGGPQHPAVLYTAQDVVEAIRGIGARDRAGRAGRAAGGDAGRDADRARRVRAGVAPGLSRRGRAEAPRARNRPCNS